MNPAIHREQILSLLRLLSSADAQRAYERSVPSARVSDELVCMWFDDQYHPDTDVHRAAFTRRERAILAEFHSRYRAVSQTLPAEVAAPREVHALAEWRGVMQAATDTLARLGVDARDPRLR